MAERIFFLERVCPVCGKTFICYPEHVYKIKKDTGNPKKVCSWGCQRKWEREHEVQGYIRDFRR